MEKEDKTNKQEAEGPLPSSPSSQQETSRMEQPQSNRGEKRPREALEAEMSLDQEQQPNSKVKEKETDSSSASASSSSSASSAATTGTKRPGYVVPPPEPGFTVLTDVNQQKKPKLLERINLANFLDRQQCHCLNQSEEHPLRNALLSPRGGGVPGERLRPAALAPPEVHAAGQAAPPLFGTARLPRWYALSPSNFLCWLATAPKNIKLFVNQQNLNFQDVDDYPPALQLTLTPQHFEEGILLQPLRFQKVEWLSIFVEDNEGGAETTIIQHIDCIGDALERIVVDLEHQQPQQVNEETAK
ncbi:Thioredoxin-like protein 1 [Balamuthia mandrillaris]